MQLKEWFYYKITTDKVVSKGDAAVSIKTGDSNLIGMFEIVALLSLAKATLLRKKEN
ncbi:hypothetical protein [Faecalibacillus intestinalis]|uniref:hypothetical protein n=1 Tax=Faecalibacillus intestinalis TaxID=1982626 RepID=UPI0004AE987E